MKTKTCTKCKEEKTVDQFPKNKQMKSGVDSWCYACRAALRRKIYRDDPASEIRYQQEYYKIHRKEIIKKHIEMDKANPEQKKERDRKYYQRHKERIIEKVRKWYADNKEKAIETIKEYRKRRPEIRRDSRRARKARVRAGGGGYTPKQWRELCEHYGNKCLCCGRTDVFLTADHIVPLDKNGSNTIDNIQPLCGICNSKKFTKIIDYRHDVFSTINL